MTKTFCDKCGKEHSQELELQEYQLTAKIEAVVEDTDKAQDYAIEYERLDLCQPCVKVLMEACIKFMAENKETSK